MGLTSSVYQINVGTNTKTVPDIGQYFRRPMQRGFFVDLSTQEKRSFLINPEKFTETYGAKWAKLDSPGLSHSHLQFVNGINTDIPLDLYYDQLIYTARNNSANNASQATSTLPQTITPDASEVTDVETDRRFLASLVAARQSDQLISASPPPVLFVWPGLIQMRVRMEKVSFNHETFDASGFPRARIFVAKVTITEEVPPGQRIYSSDVRKYGMIRPWATSLVPKPKGQNVRNANMS